MIIDWLKKEGLEVSGSLSNDILDAAFTEGYELMVLFHNKGESEPYFKAFQEATQQIQNMKFAHSGISEGV